MTTNYSRGEWLADLFPDTDVPRQMTTIEWDELVIKHKKLMKEREIEKARIDELKRKEYEETLKQKEAINYSEEMAQEICERISAGELLLNICNDSHMPTLKRVSQYLKNNVEFNAMYNQAIQDRLNIFEEEVISIADDVSNDYKEITIKNIKKRVIDPEVIARAKLRIDVRFKHLRAGRPNKWSDTSTLITKNDENAEDLTNEELERRIADLDNKAKIVKLSKLNR
jgi:hypothetical protein